MLLTPKTVEAAYVFLCATPPFSAWKMPCVEEMRFRVMKSHRVQAWFQVCGRGPGRERILAVSVNCIGHTNSLIGAVAHEMVHVYMDAHGLDTAGEHTKTFYKLARRVCKIHGFDPKTF